MRRISDIFYATRVVCTNYCHYSKLYYLQEMTMSSRKDHAEAADGERPVARIPWLPVKISKVKPENNTFFREMMTAGEEGSRRLEFYEILTKTFPFYLPQRYKNGTNLNIYNLL